MRIVIDVGHPAHVHFYKNAINEFLKKGFEVKIIARKREITYYLLDKYGFEYTKFLQGSTFFTKGLSTVKGTLRLTKIAKKFKTDLFTSTGSIQAAHASALLDKPFIGFPDTDAKKYTAFYFLKYLSVKPYANALCAPSSILAKAPPIKGIRYKGNHELAYLHPNWFKPDPSILDTAGIKEDEQFIIIRFAAWDASHDIGQKVFKSYKDRLKFIKELEKYGRVFVTSEIPLPGEFEKYRISVPAEKIHDFLFYSTMYVGEGATLASEAGVLGVPWIWLCGIEKLGYLVDQEKNYDLGYSIPTYQEALKKVQELFEKYSKLKKEWTKRRKKFLDEKIDVTAFMLWFLENYPESHKIMLDDPNYDKKFK
jgi:predicted glycosyltransferase